MKKFWTILKFELSVYLKNRIFIGTTAVLVLAILLVIFFPNIASLFRSGDGTKDSADLPVMLIYAEDSNLSATVKLFFEEAFTDYNITEAEGGIVDIKEQITSGEAECAFAMENEVSYTYYVNNLFMFDTNAAVADSILQEIYRVNAMTENGMTPEQASKILSVQIESNTIALGKDQMQNFFYTYILIFALYMVIIIYGQMVATSVATEKSSRAMELLITSANPASMMFGKIIASCTAGLIQITVVFGSAVLAYSLNSSAWGDNMIIRSVFDIPADLFIYMIVFFVLGFLIYAFMYGAIGSTASRLEDINTSTMPVSLLFMAAFFVVIFSMIGGNIDNNLIKACSYIPFTSPMAMFTRICMSTVSWYEIAVSIVILVGSTIAIGWIAAKIYRVGVLLYGSKPGFVSVIKAIKKA